VKRDMKKFVKKVKRKIPWLEHVVDDIKVATELNITPSKVHYQGNIQCILCRGAKLLCGKTSCPILAKFFSYIKHKKSLEKNEISGSSPPEVFVGRIGYPYVRIGPLTPPYRGDTRLLALTEYWLEVYKSINEIIDARIQLVRGTFKSHVMKLSSSNRLLELTQELVLSKHPADIEMKLTKRPSTLSLFDGELQPMGPSAPLDSLRVEYKSTDKAIEKVVYDEDLNAKEALLTLYNSGVKISKIQQVFSVGLLGVKRRRKLVPTRWSITAIDSIISTILRDNVVKQYKPVNEYRVYKFTILGNRFVVIMFPEKWSFEFIEAWYPGTPWNPSSREISICGDYELYKGRTSYASIGGCYYASRLAVAEYLAKEGKQAKVLVLRESYPEYILPLGVWLVREAVRKTLRTGYRKFDDLREVMEYLSTILKVKVEDWIKVSELLSSSLKQVKLEDFIRQLNH